MKALHKIKELEAKKAEAFAELIKEVDGTINRAELDKITKDLDSSKNLTSVEHDEWLHVWVRVDFSKLTSADLKNKLIQQAFSECLAEEGLTVDFKNDCLTQCIGPALIIFEEEGGRGEGFGLYNQEADKQLGTFSTIKEAVKEARKFIEGMCLIFEDRYGSHSFMKGEK